MNAARWLVVLALGCDGKDPGDDPPDDADADTDADSDSDSDADTDTDPVVDGDDDGSPVDVDCNDADDTVFPGAPDVCGDGLVTDCDRLNDDGLVTVDGEATFTDLQAALAAASDGSTVLVCAGTFVGPFVAQAAVDLVSLDGADATVLDGDLSWTTLKVPGNSTVTGFTITRGRSDRGGGIDQTSTGTLAVTDCIVETNGADTGAGIATADGSTVTIANTAITGNIAGSGGGGVYVGTGTTVDLTGSTVDGNRALYGGGLFVQDGAVVGGVVSGNISEMGDTSTGDPAGGGGVSAMGDVSLADMELTDNTAWFGGGLGLSEGAATLVGMNIHDNVVEAIGGGVFAQTATVTVDAASSITSNTADDGGGVFVLLGSWTGGAITGNQADGGGGVYLLDASLTDAAVDGNTADAGAGLWVNQDATVTGGTLIGNLALRGGGGVLVEGGFSSLQMDGTVVTDNRAEVAGGLMLEGGSAALSACTILRNTATGSGGGASAVDGGTVSSVASDWGDGGDDNDPGDVFAGGTEYLGYAAAATFDCGDGGCTPPP